MRARFVEDSRNLFHGPTGIESHETEGRLLAEDGDEHGIIADGAHEELGVLALLVERAEFLFADAQGKFLRRRETAGRQIGRAHV